MVLSQKMRLWFRLAASLWAIAVLMTPLMLYDEIFHSHTTHFTCDRGSGICAVDGNPKGVPLLAKITRVVMDHSYNGRDGPNWGINLVTSDGKKYAIEQQRAIKDSVIADYRRAAKAINAFLANPAQQKLDTSFTYRAGLSEILKTVFYLILGVVTLGMGSTLWTRRTYVFEPGRVTVSLRGPIVRCTEEITAARITTIVDRQVPSGRILELNLTDASSIQVLEAGANESQVIGPLAKELAVLLGKPLESAGA